MKTPIGIVVNDIWGNETFVIFDTDNVSDYIPDEWVSEACERQDYLTHDQLDYDELFIPADPDIIRADMECDFINDLADVIRFHFPFLRTETNLYKYDLDGRCSVLR